MGLLSVSILGKVGKELMNGGRGERRGRRGGSCWIGLSCRGWREGGW